MAFNKAKLTNDLKEILGDPKHTNNANAVAIDLTDAIDEYVRTGNAIGVDSRGDTHNLTLQ